MLHMTSAEVYFMLSRDTYRFKGTGEKLYLLGQSKTSEEITVDGHAHVEKLTFHLCRSYPVKDGDM